MKKLSVVIPVYFNELNLRKLYEELNKIVFTKLKNYNYELVFVDDGSQDKSAEIIEELIDKNKNIKLVKLSRNFGSHNAVLAGLSECTGDMAAVISADLQDPPEIILEMLQKHEEGSKAVIAVRKDREESFLQKLFSNTYYKIMQKIAIKNMPKGGFDCFLIDRKIIDVIVQMKEKNTSINGLILWCGFKLDKIYYVRKKREAGKSRWTLKKKIKYFTDSIMSFSFFPIRCISIIGLLFFLASFISLIVIFINKIFGNIPVQGYTTLILVLLMSSGLILLTLGIIGEYLWRIFDASRTRPTFIIDEVKESKKMDGKKTK